MDQNILGTGYVTMQGLNHDRDRFPWCLRRVM